MRTRGFGRSYNLRKTCIFTSQPADCAWRLKHLHTCAVPIFEFADKVYLKYTYVVNCQSERYVVFIHFYSASHSMSLSEALPTTAIDTVRVYTPKCYRQLQVKDLP